LLKRSKLTTDEIARLRRWADERLFDADYFPGVTMADVNRHNVMTEPAYFTAAEQILHGARERFYRDYLFDVRPTTDDRPYFFHTFRWKTAPHLFRTMGREWVPFIEWGYVVSVATLLQAALASVPLIALPLWRSRPRGIGAVFVYFACLGLGFMFLEMTLLQKFVLIFGHPLYAAAGVITTLLVVAGIGAARHARDARWPAAVIAALSIVAALPVPGEVMIGLVVPLAFFMGMMFPAGLVLVSPDKLPWAWGVNGCFSVIGAVLASVLAMDFGFAAVMVTAAALYATAGATFGRLRD
jgi:hypothetical protein